MTQRHARPTIGIWPTVRPAPNGRPYCIAQCDLLTLCADAQATPLILPPSPDVWAAMTDAGLLQALIVCAERDAGEQDDDAAIAATIEKAADTATPLLAIGRAAQLLARVFGAQLARPKDPEQHYCPGGDEHDSHAACCEPNSLMADVFGLSIQAIVTTRHRLAIADAPADFRATMHATADGTIEAIESTTDWPALGVQFHPETTRNQIEAQTVARFIAHIAGRPWQSWPTRRHYRHRPRKSPTPG